MDDPYDFGQIAAANALSDIYAMNARPLVAMNLAAFPCGLGEEVMGAILKGGYDKVREAGALLAGGHTIEDDEPKYGLCVVGSVHPDDMTTLGGASPGDVLVLTKAAGTGIMTTALKAGVSPLAMSPVIESMRSLNGEASEIISSLGVKAMTDVTGFGLAGHAYDMARASGLAIELWASEVPLFAGAVEMASMGMAPRNCAGEYVEAGKVALATGEIDELLVQCMFDPQTSGGLLAAVPSARAAELIASLREGPAPRAAAVGVVRGEGPAPVSIVAGRGRS